jgi:hypothetical protein
MRNLTFLCFLLAALCFASDLRANDETIAQTAAPSAAKNASNRIQVRANGRPYAMHFEQEALAFCDASGGHLVDLKTGQPKTPASSDCKRDEANTGCDGDSLDVEIRSPFNELVDFVEVDGDSYPLKGRVHDCVVLEKTIGLVTGSNVVLIDTAQNSVTQVDAHGADRIALNPHWIAWSFGSNITAVPRPELKGQQR